MHIKAECEAMTKPSDRLQGGRQDAESTGDGEAMVAFEVQRFTQEEHERGETMGWRFFAGWFQRSSGLRWAWFRGMAER